MTTMFTVKWPMCLVSVSTFQLHTPFVLLNMSIACVCSGRGSVRTLLITTHSESHLTANTCRFLSTIFTWQDHYAFCHEVLNTFLDNFDTYANFVEFKGVI